MRLWRTLGFALALVVLGAQGTAACEPGERESVQIRCAGKQVVVGGYHKNWDLQGAMDELGGACGGATAELTRVLPTKPPRDWFGGQIEWFIDGGATMLFEPWSRQREAELAVQRGSVAFGECGHLEYHREGGWLWHIMRSQPYCYHTGICNAPFFSPTLFLLYALTHPSTSALPYLVRFALLLAPLIAVSAYLGRRGELLACFAPGPFRVGLAVAAFLIPACAAIVVVGAWILDMVWFALAIYCLISLVHHFLGKLTVARPA